jgi:mannose-6-phosphate isomerase-like protein (cupin superfamily)
MRRFVAVLVAVGVAAGLVWATPGTGTTSTLIGRGSFAGPLHVKRVSEDYDWGVRIQARQGLDIAVQTITFDPGGQSGWHSHPGPVFISVVEGTMTFYEGDDPSCTPVVRTAGQGYLDAGDHPHIARNETALPAKNVVTYLVPPGAALRIDQPAPGNCPF